jgi:hypothetical protein
MGTVAFKIQQALLTPQTTAVNRKARRSCSRHDGQEMTIEIRFLPLA